MYVDCRAGGGQFRNVSVRRCHFGVRNSIGTGIEQYGCGHTVIHQMAPNGTYATSNGTDTGTFGEQYITDGTGPNLGWGSQIAPPWYSTANLRWNPLFDWSQVDHMQQDVEFVDCLFEWTDWCVINICDHTRAYSMWHGVEDWVTNYPTNRTFDINYQNPAEGWGNPPRENWVLIPDRIWNRNFTVQRCYFKGSTGTYNGQTGAVMEVCKDSDGIDNSRIMGWKDLYGNTNSGSFSNTSRPRTALFPTDWSGGTTSYTPSPYDPPTR